MNQTHLIKAKQFLFFALAVDMFFNFITGVDSYLALSKLQQVQQGVAVLDQSVINIINTAESSIKLSIFTTICVGLTLVRWLNSSYKFAREEIGITNFKYEGWTTWAWLIPGVNLFRPYQIFREIYNAGSPRVGESDVLNKKNGSPLLLSWWVLWVILHLLMLSFSKVLQKTSQDHAILTLPESISILATYIVVSLISIIVSLLWYVVIANLTKRLINCAVNISTKTNHQNLTTQAIADSTFQTPSLKSMTIAQVSNADSEIATSALLIPNQTNIEIDDDLFYETVANEIDTGKVNKGLWTKLYSQCNGDETQVKVQYIKQRVAQLAEDNRLFAQKEYERKEKEKENEESERQRLLRLLLPSITKLVDQLEANPQKVMHTSNDDESKLQLLKEFGGKIMASNISGAFYTFEFNNKVIACNSRDEFLDCIFNVLLPFAKSAKDFPLEKLRLMEKHGITYSGGNYHFKEFKYDNFNDAISYAEIEASKLHD